MEILVIVLNDLEYLDPVLEKLIELKVKGATILDSEGMANALRHKGIFKMMFTGPFQKSDMDIHSKTIFSVIPDKVETQKIVSGIKEVMSHSTKETVGFMFTSPVSGIYPMK